MLHLLPEKQKKKVLVEYRKRLVMVSGYFIIALSIIGCLLLLPAYTSTHNKYTSIKNSKDAIEKNIRALSNDKIAETVTTINQYIAALSPLGSKDTPSEVFDKINSYRGSGIKLTTLNYTYLPDGSLEASIAGISATRQNLTDFIKSLQSDTYFQGVTVPLSSFTKDRDIEFSFSMVVKGKNITTP